MSDIERTLIEIIGYVLTGGLVFLFSQRATAAKVAGATAQATAQTAQMDRSIADLIRRLDEESTLRKTATLEVNELRARLAEEREALIAHRAATTEQLASLKSTSDHQRGEIAQLTEHVSQLRAERDALKTERDRVRAERDQSRGEAASLAGEIAIVNERLAKAEKQIIELTIEKGAFELLLDRLHINVVSSVSVKESYLEAVPA
ncbi:MAG: hypothetical protein L6Q98_08380 [Anaerolineae bacterium]|nr:hypothetical protein [Anaerolineae bacterium]NUQ02605.1 hypothetical protein [Anaerolineae bacterium]